MTKKEKQVEKRTNELYELLLQGKLTTDEFHAACWKLAEDA